MKKHILLFILSFQISLHACATCMLMVPSADVAIELEINKKRLNNIHIEWLFSDIYTAELTAQYDKNSNQILDKDELGIILKAKLDYITPKEMLTKIIYEDEPLISKKYENFLLKVIDEKLVFSYDLKTEIDIKDKSVLSFSFKDDEEFFNFALTDINIKADELHYEQNLYLFTASILFNYSQTEKKQIQQPIPTEEKTQKEENPDTKLTQENLLKESIVKIKSLFENIKDEKEPYSYLLLLLFAYIYGVIHAIGPGHGKALVGSYFLSNERSYSKALFISLAIGIVHTFSAFLLTVVIYFLLNTFLARVLDDTVFYTTKISAAIIISIALYLIYKKYKAYKTIKKAKYSFSATPHISTCSCASCKVDNNSTDAALIISAGIIPCPGTITIFIFSLSLGLYFVGFLSALIMSLGMSTIIFISAILSVAVRKKSSDSGNLKKYLEYGSLFVIFSLGVLLLFQG